MFAVSGWSVSTDKLKPEVASAPANGPSATKKSRKRKRSALSENVTASNVADLWQEVIEQKEPQPRNERAHSKRDDKKGRNDKKRQKLNSDNVPAEPKEDASAENGEQEAKQVKQSKPEKLSSKDKKDKKDKKDTKDTKDTKDKKGKKDKHKSKGAGDSPSTKDAAPTGQKSPTKAITPAVPAPPKLTPLQASMREKLISARFRHLNETLYTRPSAEAFNLFEESPEMFTEYHEGFRRQVDVWPENPVQGYLADIRQRGRQRYPSRDHHRNRKPNHKQHESSTAVQPLPRNRATGMCTIADLGCGDARLASELQPDRAKLRLEILSYDLHSPHPLVTKADIANLPLADGSVDVAIFCLALMGTNWIDFIEEAYRILRWKGELWVAEIKSRFGHVGGGKKGVVEHSVGNRRKPGAVGGKKAKTAKDDIAAAEAALLVEVDGMTDTRQQTDVSAFIEVLNKRGFVIQGQGEGPGSEAIDLSNTMFVKMRFLKAAPAVKGKCAQKEEDRPRFGAKPPMAKKPKFIETDDEKDGNEAAVLKPCVYKIR